MQWLCHILDKSLQWSLWIILILYDTSSEVGLELCSFLDLSFILKVHLPSPMGVLFHCRTCRLLAMKQDLPWDVGDEPLGKNPNSKEDNNSSSTSEGVMTHFIMRCTQFCWDKIDWLHQVWKTGCNSFTTIFIPGSTNWIVRQSLFVLSVYKSFYGYLVKGWVMEFYAICPFSRLAGHPEIKF